MRNGILCCSESGGLTLDLYVSSPCAMGIISKSVAHACSGGARGFFKPNDQEYGKAAGFVKFYRDQEKPGRYVSEFKDPARVSCKHAHRAADTCTVRYNDTNHMVLVPYSYNTIRYSHSTVPNPAREKNYEHDYCTSTERIHDESILAGVVPSFLPPARVPAACLLACMLASLHACLFDGCLPDVRDSFGIRSRFVRDACLPACLPAGRTVLYCTTCRYGSPHCRSGFVRNSFGNRSGCLPSCLPPCMHVDTGALIVGRDAFGIRSGFVWDSFEIRSGCLPSCLPPCRSYGTVLHYM